MCSAHAYSRYASVRVSARVGARVSCRVASRGDARSPAPRRARDVALGSGSGYVALGPGSRDASPRRAAVPSPLRLGRLRWGPRAMDGQHVDSKLIDTVGTPKICGMS